jgi:hypothetical protein
MTSSPVSFQGFTYENDMCDTLKLSHPRGAPHQAGVELGIPGVELRKPFRILVGA